MKNQKYIDEIREIVKNHPMCYSRILCSKGRQHRKNPTNKKYLYNYIIENTPLLNDPKYTFATRVYWIINDIEEFPTCKLPACNNKLVNVVNVFTGYKKYCCKRCCNSSEEYVENIKNGIKIIHGNPNYNGDRIKAKEVRIANNGGTYFSKEQLEKGRQTRIKRYGNPTYNNSEKSAKTYFDKTGYDNPFKNPEIIEKNQIKKNKTVFERYGVKNIIQLKEVRSKCHRKYFYDNMYFDSSWELAFYIFYKDKNVKIKRESVSFKYIGEDGKEHFYFPDFEVNGVLYELKGTHFFNKHGEPIYRQTGISWKNKYDCMMQNNVILIRDSTLYISYVKSKYGKNYLKQFKRQNNNKKDDVVDADFEVKN